MLTWHPSWASRNNHPAIFFAAIGPLYLASEVGLIIGHGYILSGLSGYSQNIESTWSLEDTGYV